MPDPVNAPDVDLTGTVGARSREDAHATQHRAPPSAYLRALGALERADHLDPVIRFVEPVADRLVAGRRRRRLLHGEATGIPLHPILTDVPFGAWFMAQYLDLVGGVASRPAATRLVGLGLAAWVPTAVAGWAEWALSDRGTRRVGIVHAAANAVAALIYLASWRARRRGRHDVGVGLARLGGALLVVGGFLGGYMRSERPPEPTDDSGTAAPARVGL